MNANVAIFNIIFPFLDIWSVQPPGPFYHKAPSNDDPRFASNPKPPGLHYASPPGPFLPALQPGDFSYVEKTYEHGNYDTDSEEESPPSQYLPAPVPALNMMSVSSPLALNALLDRFRLGYPFMDYMLLARQHPTGTYTLSNDNYEHGRNQWHDSFGASNGPVKQLDSFRDPRRLKYFRRPVRQTVGNTVYGTDEVSGLSSPTVELV